LAGAYRSLSIWGVFVDLPFAGLFSAIAGLGDFSCFKAFFSEGIREGFGCFPDAVFFDADPVEARPLARGADCDFGRSDVGEPCVS
jgi:hypothetical protein